LTPEKPVLGVDDFVMLDLTVEPEPGRLGQVEIAKTRQLRRGGKTATSRWNG
jgi:hypothetical protein